MATRTETITTRDRDVTGSRGWGPVLSGSAAAFVTFVTFSALWMALAAMGSDWVGSNLAWFELFTALGAAPVGGFVAGWLQSDDARSGTFQGLATWGLVIFAGLIVGVPSSAAVFSGATNIALQSLTGGQNVATQLGQVSAELWSTFVIFGGGALLAAIAGAAGSGLGTGRARTRDEVVVDHDADSEDRAPVGAGTR